MALPLLLSVCYRYYPRQVFVSVRRSTAQDFPSPVDLWDAHGIPAGFSSRVGSLLRWVARKNFLAKSPGADPRNILESAEDACGPAAGEITI